MTSDRPIRVLLVDDDPATLQMYRMALEGTAEVVTEALSDRAVDLAKETRPEVIVLDLAMPEVDGWQLCHALRNDVATTGVPVLVLTGHDDVDVPARAIKAGVRAVLVKPCPIDRFLLAIRAAAEVGMVQRRQELIRRLYDFFNDRRFVDAAAMFEDAMQGLRHPLRREGFIAFANGWVGAFPDGWLNVVSIQPDTDAYEVDVMAVGTHLGDLSLVSGEVLRPAQRQARIPIRHTIRFSGDRIAASVLSFDTADLTRQLERRESSGGPFRAAASVFREGFVRIAVQPALARLGRGDHRVLRLVRVLARVAVRRGVAAQRHAAGLARAQMHPPRAGLHALLAFAARRVSHAGDGGEMRTITHECQSLSR